MLSIGGGECIFLRNLRTNSTKSNSRLPDAKRGRAIPFESVSLNRDDKSQNWNSQVRYLPPQPASRSTIEGGAVLVESTAFYRIFVRLSKVSGLREWATLARSCRKSPAQTGEIPVFEETIGGDGLDRHCDIGQAVKSAPFFRPDAVHHARQWFD